MNGGYIELVIGIINQQTSLGVKPPCYDFMVDFDRGYWVNQLETYWIRIVTFSERSSHVESDEYFAAW